MTDEYIAKLNSEVSGGIFVKAAELTEDTTGPVVRYWVDYVEPITCNGHTYQPIQMHWKNFGTSQSMPIESGAIAGSNLAKMAGKYVKQIDVTENPVTVRLLHMDLLNQTSGHWVRVGEVLSVQATSGMVVFSIGRRLGRNTLPRKIFLQSEFPALNTEVPKILG